MTYQLKEMAQSWPRGYQTVSCSAQQSMKFILLTNVKMPTIVGILTFRPISRIDTTSESFKTRTIFISHQFTFYEHLKVHVQLS